MCHHGHPPAVHEDPENPCLGTQFVESGELGGAGVDEFAVGGQVGMRVLARRGVGLGPAALLGHQLAEAELVDGKPCLGSHFQGQVDREAVGVVQGEGVGPAQHRLAGRASRLRGLLEQPRTRRQGAVERGLLGHRDPVDAVEVGDQFGVRRSHRVAHGHHQVGHHGLFDAEQFGGADDPAQQPAQHVAAALVAGRHTVADDDRRGPAVVGDDPVADVVLVVARAVAPGRDGGHHIDDGAQQVGFVDVVHALQQAGHPLDAHAGVDVLARQRPEDLEVVLGGALAALVLHEHEVPDLDVAVLVGNRGRPRCRTPVRGRSRSPTTARTARGCPSTSSCRPCRGAGCARRADRRSPATARRPRHRRSRRWPTAFRDRTRSRRPPPGWSAAPRPARWRRA